MQIENVLEQVARSYPEPQMVQWQLREIPRMAFSIRLATARRNPKELSICDIGGGVSLFSAGCAALGMRSVLVDDFDDPGNHRDGEKALTAHKKYGVEIIRRDAIRDGFSGLGEFDAITTFDSMEHWHASPKALFSQVRQSIKPGGGVRPRRPQLRKHSQADHSALRVWQVERHERLVRAKELSRPRSRARRG